MILSSLSPKRFGSNKKTGFPLPRKRLINSGKPKCLSLISKTPEPFIKMIQQLVKTNHDKASTFNLQGKDNTNCLKSNKKTIINLYFDYNTLPKVDESPPGNMRHSHSRENLSKPIMSSKSYKKIYNLRNHSPIPSIKPQFHMLKPRSSLSKSIESFKSQLPKPSQLAATKLLCKPQKLANIIS